MELYHTSRENIPCADFMTEVGHYVAVGVEAVMTPTIPRGCLDMVLKDQ